MSDLLEKKSGNNSSRMDILFREFGNDMNIFFRPYVCSTWIWVALGVVNEDYSPMLLLPDTTTSGKGKEKYIMSA